MIYQKIGLAKNKIPAFAGMTNQGRNCKDLIFFKVKTIMCINPKNH